MALLTARGFVAEDNATSYLGEIMLRDDQKLRVSGDSRDKPRRGVFHHSAGIRPIGWVGPRFYMNCSKTSLQPRFHSPPKSLAMNVPLSDPRHVPVLRPSGMRAPLHPAQIVGPPEDICPAVASLITTPVHPVAVNGTRTWVKLISLRRSSCTCYLKILKA